jgi:hypothetical protein
VRARLRQETPQNPPEKMSEEKSSAVRAYWVGA